MMHGKSLYGWTNNGEEKLELIANNASNMYYLSDDVLFFLKTREMKVGQRTVENSRIYMIESQFGNY